MLIFTTSTFQLPKTNVSSFYCQEAPYLELPTLEGHQPWSRTHCIPMFSTSVSITDTVITTIETQTVIIVVI